MPSELADCFDLKNPHNVIDFCWKQNNYKVCLTCEKVERVVSFITGTPYKTQPNDQEKQNIISAALAFQNNQSLA